MSIVVTGATGHLGRSVVEELLGRGVPAEQVVAGGRALDRVADLADRGVRTVRLDYDDPTSVDAAISEGDTILLISGSEVGHRVHQHRTVVDAAARVGAARLVYTSVLGGSTPLPLAPDHVATEAMVTESGVPFTLLRHGWYTENYVPGLHQAAQTGEVVGSVGDGRVASAPRADYAAAAAVVLTEPGDHERVTYELSGDHAWTHDELAGVFAELLGRPVAYRDLPPDQHLAVLRQVGLDEGTADFVVALDGAIRDGLLGPTPGDLSRLIGRPTTPLIEALRPHVPTT